jgi:RNA polymerase sigma-70 factor, ECF subfamily
MKETPEAASWREAEHAARHAYGRLVAWLAWQWRDLAAAQDALGEAFLSALKHWPRDGVPDSPEAWLLTVAKRELLMQSRHHRVAQAPEVLAVFDLQAAATEPSSIPDRRLQLMCACVHPAVPESLHAPLMMQVVLGLGAQTIARAFLESPAAMAQRLVRAKAKLREAGVAFETPESDELPLRLQALREALYGAYTVGSNLASPAPEAEPALCEEALFLASLLASLQPRDAEAHGLLALMLHAQARQPGQFDASDRFVPLTQQDTRLWRHDLLLQAEATLNHAASLRQPGPFQIEAAIQSAHNQRAFTGQTPWSAIAELYALLVAQTGGIGARIGHAVAVSETGDTARALTLLDALPVASVVSHQPYWAARTHLLERACRSAEAASARERAMGLTADERVRRFLAQAPQTPEGSLESKG